MESVAFRGQFDIGHDQTSKPPEIFVHLPGEFARPYFVPPLFQAATDREFVDHCGCFIRRYRHMKLTSRELLSLAFYGEGGSAVADSDTGLAGVEAGDQIIDNVNVAMCKSTPTVIDHQEFAFDLERHGSILFSLLLSRCLNPIAGSQPIMTVFDAHGSATKCSDRKNAPTTVAS